MIRFLSYIYPITKTVTSDHSGTLEITWYNGKKYLNTKHANYSYGSLQHILKFGLYKINLKKTRSILILGLGGGSVIETLKTDFNFDGPITAVEIDPVVIAVAKEEFHISEGPQLKIICEDARDFLQKNTRQFDLVIVDLFIDNQVPKDFYATGFWKTLIKSNSKNGQVLFNAALSNHSKETLGQVIKILQTNSYRTDIHTKVNGTNTVLIAQR